ncbi:MAG: preprotein translocase subunit SecA [Spirochaetae bacterium HGW-Spirochaetae-1]|nr:MAG: preprotein translocase subunit SecA [Spirochaetae bacterium HGW-Spirochaetae-1]
MLDLILYILFGSKFEREMKRIRPIVNRINSLEAEMKKLSSDEMKAKTGEFRDRLKGGASLESLLPEAFALVREASVRTLGMRPFDVQLIGGIVLHEGRIAEMKTGEGKTLVAVMPAYLHALTDEGVHIITVNDYLARRDAQWVGRIYTFLGLSVGVIQQDMDVRQRQIAYNCDVVYGMNSEFGFDYLRDNMAVSRAYRVQRGHVYAIVDEVDSILIDEARTPLIISGQAPDSQKNYILADGIVSRLKPGADYEIREKEHTALFTEEGVRRAEGMLHVDNLYDVDNLGLVHCIGQALKAHGLFKRDVDYIVEGGQVLIVDEFTGRVMAGRRYSDGLHEALEAKEGVKIARETMTHATISFQNYFRMYKRLAGMSGTADSEAFEFRIIYNLDVVVIPTNEPMIRKDHTDQVFMTEAEKFEAVAREIGDMANKGRPVLTGTVSVEKSEKLSRILKSRGIRHNVLNAKNHEREAAVIAEAGRPGAVTIATNMAGRGTDIVLGGSRTYIDELEAYEPVIDKAAWDDFRGLVLKDDLDAAVAVYDRMPGEERQKAEEIIKKAYEWDGNHRAVVEAGGLHIIGTERHEAGRVDNQLRGRSGRQGDPGSSRFFISLDDSIVRIYGAKDLPHVLKGITAVKGESIWSSDVYRLIEKAQKGVEKRNFEIRKHLLDYDEIMNTQRLYIYGLRDRIIDGNDISGDVMRQIKDLCRREFEPYLDNKHNNHVVYEEIDRWLRSMLGLDMAALSILPDSLTMEELSGIIEERIIRQYAEKKEALGAGVLSRVEGMITLRTIDALWVEHLLAMDELREGIWTAGYSERDPLVEYRIQGSLLFDQVMRNIEQGVVQFILRMPAEAMAEMARQDTGDGTGDVEFTGKEYASDNKKMKYSEGSYAGDKEPGKGNSGNKVRITTGGVERKSSRRAKRR